jgi:4-amino-4-deoxy-L-arabinose transferase-like glycosyltransferase
VPPEDQLGARPPGYWLLLAACFKILGNQDWVPTALNLLLFAVCIPTVYQLAMRVADRHVARLATLLLCVWPNYLFTAGIASTEMLLVTLLPLAVWLFLSAAPEAPLKRQAGLLLGAGVVFGSAALTQPTMLLLPGALLVHELLSRRSAAMLTARLALVSVGLLLVVLPWAVRYGDLSQGIVVSSNGGSNFYRANNPLATGGFTPRGERDLSAFDRAERNRLGFAWGREWIAAHPGGFLKLAARKLVLFLGDDSNGAFETLRRSETTGTSPAARPPPAAVYFAFKGLANAYWLLIWLLILVACWRPPLAFGLPRSEAGAGVLLGMTMVLLLAVVHAVFESNGKYHTPLFGLLAVVAATAADPAAPGRLRPPHSARAQSAQVVGR